MFKIQLVHRFNQALLLTMLAVFGMVTNADVDQSRLDAVKADLQSRINENKLSGAVVMVAQDGEVLMHEALGYQNVEDQVPMSTDTIFRIFSMTKPVTGTALMKVSLNLMIPLKSICRNLLIWKFLFLRTMTEAGKQKQPIAQ